MTEEDRRICEFIRERHECEWMTVEDVHEALHKTLFYARVRLTIAVNDFKELFS